MVRPVRFISLQIALILVVAAHAAGQGGQAESDLRRMQGQWVVVAAAADGKDIKRDKQTTVTFQGNVMTTREGAQVISEATFTLDPSKTPRAVDFNPVRGDKTPFLGIYEFKDDQFKLCFSLAEQDRPTAFVTAAGKDHALVIMKRVK